MDKGPAAAHARSTANCRRPVSMSACVGDRAARSTADNRAVRKRPRRGDEPARPFHNYTVACNYRNCNSDGLPFLILEMTTGAPVFLVLIDYYRPRPYAIPLTTIFDCRDSGVVLKVALLKAFAPHNTFLINFRSNPSKQTGQTQILKSW